MRSVQKAALLLSLVAYPLVLLFMDGMNYKGIGVVAVAGVALICALVRSAWREARG